MFYRESPQRSVSEVRMARSDQRERVQRCDSPVAGETQHRRAYSQGDARRRVTGPKDSFNVGITVVGSPDQTGDRNQQSDREGRHPRKLNQLQITVSTVR